MRCSNCNKFVAQDLGDPEVNDLSIGADGMATCEVSAIVNCAECSSELKRGDFSIEKQVEGVADHLGGGHELSIEEDSSEGIENWITKDKNGKPIKNARYHTHLYGARVTAKVTCECNPDWSAEVVFEDTMPAGSMNESA